jgi:hypothetical protein
MREKLEARAMSCVELVRQSFMGDGDIARGAGISRNEPYGELWKRLRHKDILARQPQSRDSEIELPRAARATLLDIVRGSPYSISRLA